MNLLKLILRKYRKWKFDRALNVQLKQQKKDIYEKLNEQIVKYFKQDNK